jgi:hypothetical protein
MTEFKTALASLALLAGLACGDAPTAPAEPKVDASLPSPTSAVRLLAEPDNPSRGKPPTALHLEAALSDALVQEVLAGLEDPLLADELDDALDSLLDLVEEPGSKTYASAFARVQKLVDRYLSDPETSANDQIALSVLDIALLSV